MLKRAKNRYEKQLEGDQNVKKRRTSDKIAVEVPTLTRSKTTPFNKNTCFFCGDPARYQDLFIMCPLHRLVKHCKLPSKPQAMTDFE